MGLSVDKHEDRMKLPTEDYLHSLITFIGELVRPAFHFSIGMHAHHAFVLTFSPV